MGKRTISNLTLLSVLAFFALGVQHIEASDLEPLIALELEIQTNTLDGCTSCGCRIKGELEPGRKGNWWFAFGLAKADAEQGWVSSGAPSHCGAGTFKKVAENFTQSVGNPYVVIDLSTTAKLGRDGTIVLDTKLDKRKLADFDRNGQATYRKEQQAHTLIFSEYDFQVLPVIIPQERERDAFGVHEVLLDMRAGIFGQHKASGYGSISVISDVPGAEITLDGGFAGRSGGEQATLLSPAAEGKREILVRDFSGREASKQVKVEPDTVSEVSIQVLGLSTKDAENGLIPIGLNSEGFQEYWRQIDNAMMVRIPEGEFLMGSPEGKGEKHEQPQHTVYVSAFLMDKTEVTWRQYLEYVGEEGVSPPPDPIWGVSPDYAISFVLWSEARGYCEWAGGRLPTEAEWEKAARGTDGRTYPWGDDWDATRCNTIAGGMHQPESVGHNATCLSPYGLLNMAGNVQEWTADRYGEDYYLHSPGSNPTGPESGRMRVMRGGGWMSQPTWSRTAYRASRAPTSRNMDHGFRCARDVGGGS